MITGANGGLGKEAARQLALIPETEKIYLACRNATKAQAAKQSLEAETGRSIFEIVIMDVSKPESVRNAVASLEGTVDALIMNAGGMGGKEPGELTSDGVTQMFASNVLGHAVLLDELVKADKLKNVALYAGSEAARGVKKMGMKRPIMKNHTKEEFASVFDGSFFGKKYDPMEAYGFVKYVAALWMSSEARKHPNIRFITMSPGGTSGTSVMNDLPPLMRFAFKYLAVPIFMPLMGMIHKVEKGAARYLDGISNQSLRSGGFYGSKAAVLTGPVIDQSNIFPDLNNTAHQDNVKAAIERFISR